MSEIDINGDLTLLEEDSSLRTVTNADFPEFDTVTEVKAIIADSIGTFTSGANRLIFAHYIHFDGEAAALINAADFTGLESKSDLASVKLGSVAAEALGTVTGFNMTIKSNSLGGSS